jgi:dipeptidyl aminopeptidase/acylaminoacyl peptidase
MPARKRPMQINDLFRFNRVADAQISPDGKRVAYVLTTVDLGGNATSSSIWLAATAGDNKPHPLTVTTKKDRHPRWSPDGRRILFESNRSGDVQLWSFAIDGGEARKLTSISTEASDGIWSPDGRWIAFLSTVHPEYSSRPFAEADALNKKRKEEIEKRPVKARVFTRMFYRHWDEWVEDKRKHLFVMPAEGGEPRNVTPGDRDATPTSSTFSVGDDFTFTPDSKALVYTAGPEENEAWNTNFDLCRVPIGGGRVKCLTTANKAADGAPRFSPDGKLLAYRAQARPGYEADRWQLMVMDADGGTPRSIMPDFDGSVESLVWSPDNKTIYITTDARGSVPVLAVSVKDGKMRTVAETGCHGSVSVSRDGKLLAFTRSQMRHPDEVFVMPANGEARNLSQVNTGHLDELDLPRPESLTVPGADGTPMQMWLLKPPGFDAKKKWPLAFVVHGGPQGAWHDGWSFRWCPELWAAQGYVVALPNPRGSTGFGQKYTDEISADWGGKCFDDLMAGLAYLEKQPYIDTHRLAAAGASFGGYMMNWFQGHTDKFKTLISHCGVYNLDSMYATTEEIWFDEWEHGGPPWENRDSYERHSPHRFAKDFRTPMLIIHNDLDFRVPVSEGLQMFQTLQRLGVESKMINFPDEGHWVLKPANSDYWHTEVFDWLKKHVPPGPK